MAFIQEFKQFAMRGSVVDMAVGVIIGAAFGKIITSLVDDLIMPIVGLLTGGVKFTNLHLVLKPASFAEDGTIINAVTLDYGQFIQHAVDFFIISFCIFTFIRLINRLRSEEATGQTESSPPPTKEQLLLTEIRDLLKSRG